MCLHALIWLGAYRADRCKHLVRLIQFSHQGICYRYITNVLDPQLLSIHDAARLYARRWDIELAFKLLKKELGLSLWWASHPTLVLQQRMPLPSFSLKSCMPFICRLPSKLALTSSMSPCPFWFLFFVSLHRTLWETPWSPCSLTRDPLSVSFALPDATAPSFLPSSSPIPLSLLISHSLVSHANPNVPITLDPPLSPSSLVLPPVS